MGVLRRLNSTRGAPPSPRDADEHVDREGARNAAGRAINNGATKTPQQAERCGHAQARAPPPPPVQAISFGKHSVAANKSSTFCQKTPALAYGARRRSVEACLPFRVAVACALSFLYLRTCLVSKYIREQVFEAAGSLGGCCRGVRGDVTAHILPTGRLSRVNLCVFAAPPWTAADTGQNVLPV
ncbi:hypothetical protein EVAR_91471_1 [Eumeta japonica]|uniref:Uncharacterized protein n=1 Tax=Eumeta variegata TaxID=151549 RepID=A0A4C1X382_EUMVA|nr:hypothetical protein EVAR_91471_1 [Eumeta japonica]